MAYNPDWMPLTQENRLAMGRSWARVLGEKGALWGIPGSEVAELAGLVEEADGCLAQAMSSGRTKVVTARCREAIKAMVACMRRLKARRLFCTPLTGADLVLLWLKPRDTVKTPVPLPLGQARAEITYPGVHLLKLHIYLLEGSLAEPGADFGYRIYWGVMPHGGATMEEAVSQRRYLHREPVSGEELPHSKFTRCKKKLFDFPGDDSAKTAWFCIRLENGKGEAGPWGPLFSAVIP
jgi:hypothetical protein